MIAMRKETFSCLQEAEIVRQSDVLEVKNVRQSGVLEVKMGPYKHTPGDTGSHPK